MAEVSGCADLAASCLGELSEKLRWALARLPLASDAEAAHDARVALRRLRSASSSFSACLTSQGKWRRRLRQAEKELGGIRDAEVRLQLLDEVLGPVAVARDGTDHPPAGPGPDGGLVLEKSARIRPGLRGLEMEARRALADATAAEIDEQRRRVLAEGALERYQALAQPPALKSDPAGRIPVDQLAEQQLPSLFQQAGRMGRGETDLHRRRIQIRKVRYRLEALAPGLGPGQRTVLQELRQVQGLLGRFHDLVVLADWIGGSSRKLRHELRPALRRLAVRVELEQQAAREAAETELARLDQAGWWTAAEAAVLGVAVTAPRGLGGSSAVVPRDRV